MRIYGPIFIKSVNLFAISYDIGLRSMHESHEVLKMCAMTFQGRLLGRATIVAGFADLALRVPRPAGQPALPARVDQRSGHQPDAHQARALRHLRDSRPGAAARLLGAVQPRQCGPALELGRAAVEEGQEAREDAQSRALSGGRRMSGGCGNGCALSPPFLSSDRY